MTPICYNSPVRLCVYKDSLSVGRGADKAVKNFAAAMSARGHAVRLVERGELAAALEKKWDAFVATGSNEAVDLDRAGYFERTGRAPVVLQLHLAPHGFFKWKHPFRNRAIRKAFDKFDAVQVLCHDYESEFKGLAPHPAVVTIGNYTEIEPIPRREEKLVLCPAAVVNRVKNQSLLIRAFAAIAADFPEWRVRLLGRTDTSVADSCRRLAHRLGVDDRVEFAGLASDMAAEYARAAFVAFPSTLEGFPLAVLEAAKFSLPVVAQKKLPGVRDMVLDGETGFVAEPTVEAYSAALARLMSDGGLRAKMCEKAHAYCEERYSRESVLSEWERLLARVAGE